jgi:hypothetical protein
MNEDNDEVLLTLDLKGAIHEFASRYDKDKVGHGKRAKGSLNEKKDGYDTVKLIVQQIQQQVGLHGRSITDSAEPGWRAMFSPERPAKPTPKPTLRDLMSLITALSSDTFLNDTKQASGSRKGKSTNEKKKSAKETKSATKRHQNTLKLIKRILSCVTIKGAVEQDILHFGDVMKRIAKVTHSVHVD